MASREAAHGRQHREVIAKLVVTVRASAILLLQVRPIGQLADAAAIGAITGDGIGQLRVQLVANAVAALIVLVIAAVLSVHTKRGMTSYSQRHLRHE